MYSEPFLVLQKPIQYCIKLSKISCNLISKTAILSLHYCCRCFCDFSISCSKLKKTIVQYKSRINSPPCCPLYCFAFLRQQRNATNTALLSSLVHSVHNHTSVLQSFRPNVPPTPPQSAPRFRKRYYEKYTVSIECPL